jgi:NAD(P)-dependent dehydrogenase (short-subunit alcohol dehydrogenase family)
LSEVFSLGGRRALVTGGTQGVGSAIAVALAKAGADVLILGLNEDHWATRTLDQCRQFGVKVDLLTCDLSQEPQSYLDELMQSIESTMPGIDLLCNNAGTFMDVPFLEMDYARYQKTFHLNVTSGYFLTQAFARRWIIDKTDGRVVFTGSINGLLAEPVHTAYDASKGAVAALVRSLCVSLAPHGIRVNSIAPGLIRTPLTASFIDQPRSGSWMRHHTPNGQIPGPEACGDAVVFLLSDAAMHIHGQTLYVDGGMSVWQQPDPPSGWQGSGTGA